VNMARIAHPRFIIQNTSSSKATMAGGSEEYRVVNCNKIYALAPQKLMATKSVSHRQIGHCRSAFRHRAMNRISDGESLICQ
jgi:hypothetical protein